MIRNLPPELLELVDRLQQRKMLATPARAPFAPGDKVICRIEGVDIPAIVESCAWLAGFQEWNVDLKVEGRKFAMPESHLISQIDYLRSRTLTTKH